MNICIETSEVALSDHYGYFQVGGWCRLPFQYADLSLKPSDKKTCSIRHIGNARYSVVARVDQVVTNTIEMHDEPEQGQLVIISLGQQGLYFFTDNWDMYEQKFCEYGQGDYIEGELSLFLDAGLMRPFEYGLYEKIPEASRHGFYIARVACITEITSEGTKSLDLIDCEAARKRQSTYIIEFEPGSATGDFIRDDLTLKTLDYYLDRKVALPNDAR